MLVVNNDIKHHTVNQSLGLSLSKRIVAMGAVSMLIYSAPGQASELSATINAGYDSNPYRLSSRHNPDSTQFVSTKLRGQLDVHENLYLKAQLNDHRYSSSSRDADHYKLSGGFGFKEKVDWWDLRSRVSSELTVGMKDKTYISRLTGNVGESGGEQIADRYDYRFAVWENGLATRWDKKHRTKLYFEVEDRDYEDFNIADLSNFDYLEYRLGARWKYKFSKRTAIKLHLEKNIRDYDDKRSRDLAGSSIDGTDLRYDGWQLGARYQFKADENLRASFQFQYDHREDNGSGYYDWARALVKAGVTYSFEDQSKLKASIAFHDSQYDKRAANATADDEDLSEEQGLRYKLSYEQPIASVAGLNLLTSIRYDDIDADLSDYQYNRTQASLGLKYQF